jgi:Winged helix-turn-helix DNA-binding
MDREELLKLHAALGSLLALPDSIRELLAQWLETSKPNGRDLHPSVPTSPPRPVTPIPAKAAHDNSAHARAAERKLLAAMRERPGLSAASLAKVVGAGLSTTKERLRRMGAQELIEKDPSGRWRVKAEEARDTGDEARPTIAPPS